MGVCCGWQASSGWLVSCRCRRVICWGRRGLCQVQDQVALIDCPRPPLAAWCRWLQGAGASTRSHVPGRRSKPTVPNAAATLVTCWHLLRCRRLCTSRSMVAVWLWDWLQAAIGCVTQLVSSWWPSVSGQGACWLLLLPERRISCCTERGQVTV